MYAASRQRSSPLHAWTSRPRIRTEPADGFSNPHSSLPSVDFPAPLSPTTRIPPASAAIVKPSTIARPSSYAKLTPVAESTTFAVLRRKVAVAALAAGSRVFADDVDQAARRQQRQHGARVPLRQHRRAGSRVADVAQRQRDQ